MTITLYDCSTAPSPRRARILLAEKGIAHDTINIDLSKGEQLGAAYRAINPLCTVPALQLEDGQLLTDNAGIAAYLEARYPDKPMLGTTPMEKAQIASWNSRIDLEGFIAIAEALRNSSPHLVNRALPGPVNYPQIPELAERGLTRLQHFFAVLDAQLEGRDNITGMGFSMADISAVVAVDFARMVRVKPGEQHTNLLRWRAAMALRPSMLL